MINENSKSTSNIKMNKKFMEGIAKCAELYGFKVEDAISRIMESKKKVKVVAPKALFALPFSGEKNDLCCEGLRYNEGLYTQCEVVKKGENKYCKVCENGKEKYGTIDDRMKVGIMEYKDASGKGPIHYSKIMKKRKLSKEEVIAEGKKMGRLISEIHFEVQEEKRGRPKAVKVVKEKSEKKKGRPKKESKGLELETKTTDLFASLIANSSSEIDDMCASEFENKSNENGVKKIDVKVENVMSEKEKKAQEKAQEKAKKEEEKAQEKAKKEEEKAKKELEKAQEKAKKELEKAKKEEEKAKKAEEKAKKDDAKSKKKVSQEKNENKEVSQVKEEKKAVVIEEEPEEEEPDVVKKIKFEGVTYLKSKKSGIIYSMDQDKIGRWDDKNEKIIFDIFDGELSEEECE